MPRRSPSPKHDVVTLADLAPRRRITGGSERRVFGANPIQPEEGHMAKPGKKEQPSKKDLPPKKAIKGGGLTPNENLTLVRAARPAKQGPPAAKDLPAKKPVKGGKKRT